jgi:dipeptidyl aminopeptidase/acylaminoacyl peptidase
MKRSFTLLHQTLWKQQRTRLSASLHLLLFLPVLCFVLLLSASTVSAQSDDLDAPFVVEDVCTVTGVQARPAQLETGGVILAALDRRNQWAINLDRRTRYPLPGTRPCAGNCHLSPDSRWITYLDNSSEAFGQIRLDGSEATPIIEKTTELTWWSEDTLLAWSSTHRARLIDLSGQVLESFDTRGIISIQPGGYWALRLIYEDGVFRRVLEPVNQPESDTQILLGEDRQNFSATDWSSDGRYLAYISPSLENPDSGEVSLIAPDEETEPTQLTDFASEGGLQLGGQTPGGLRWSPDGEKLAFWSLPIVEAGEEQRATLHVIDLPSGEIRRLCGLTIDLTEQTITPDPPQLIWSWDSQYVAFGANPDDNMRGTLLIAVNVEDGVYIELSDGLTSAPGGASVVAWGRLPQ